MSKLTAKGKKHLDKVTKRVIRGEEWIRLDDALKLVSIEKPSKK